MKGAGRVLAEEFLVYLCRGVPLALPQQIGGSFEISLVAGGAQRLRRSGAEAGQSARGFGSSDLAQRQSGGAGHGGIGVFQQAREWLDGLAVTPYPQRADDADFEFAVQFWQRVAQGWIDRRAVVQTWRATLAHCSQEGRVRSAVPMPSTRGA